MKEIPWIFFRTLPKRSIGARLLFLIYLQRVETGWEAAGQIKSTCTYEMNNLYFLTGPSTLKKTGIRHDFIHLFPVVYRKPKTIMKMFRIWEFLLCYNVYVSTFLFYLWLKFSVFVSSMFSYFSRSMNAGENHNNGIFSIPIYRFLSLMILFYYTGICADISMV